MDETLSTRGTDRLLWIDLEMTGLDPTKDVILEVAAIVTDWDLKELAVFESGVGHGQARVQELLDASDWYTHVMPKNKKMFLKLNQKSPDARVVETRLLEFVKHYCPQLSPVIVAGNSIHIDRQFIKAEWPLLDQQLHYRMLDVTAWKVVFEAKYGTSWKKPDHHRALDDIRGSIDELKQYLERIR